jgi:hypothetical protein
MKIVEYLTRINHKSGRKRTRDKVIFTVWLSLWIMGAALWFILMLLTPTPAGRP